MTSPIRKLIRKNQRYAGSAIRRIATTVTATMRPADPLRLNPVRLNPERLPDSGSISFILPPVRQPTHWCGVGFLFGGESCLGGPPNFCGFDSIFGCVLLVYYTVCYAPPDF